MFPLFSSLAPTDVTIVSTRGRSALLRYTVVPDNANSVVTHVTYRKKYMDLHRLLAGPPNYKSSDTSLRVRSYVVYPVHRKFLKLYQQWTIWVRLLRKHLQDYVRRVDDSTSMTSLPDLEVRCSVHTCCGSLQSAARSIFKSAVLLTVPY
jgi:bacterioferritin-associated ferredoxin